MMGKTVFLIKGTSGVGKSSRVYVFLKFLTDVMDEKTENVFFNKEGKEKFIGFSFPDLGNLLFLGKLFTKGGVEKWQGYDNLTSTLGNAEGLTNFLRENNQYSPVIEGAGTTATFRLRPDFLYKECGYTKMFFQYYNYVNSQKQEYMERIMGRSGKYPGDQMWEKNSGFVKESEKVQTEIESLSENEAVKILLFVDPYNESISDWGMKMITLLYPHELHVDIMTEFLFYTEKLNYQKTNLYHG